MRLFLSFCLLLLFLPAKAQTIGPHTIYDWLVTAVHPNGCNPNYVTGPPNDSTWVNFSNGDVMTGMFGSTHVDGPGVDIVFETSYNTDNLNVRLKLQGGGFSNVHSILTTDWIAIPNVFWKYTFTTCGTGSSNSNRWYVDLDFITDFGLTPADVVEGVEVTFVTSSGAPDIAGVYIVQNIPPPCDTLVFSNDTTLCQGETLLLDATTAGATYLWQDNSTNATFNVTSAGTYWVEVTEACGTYIDTIVVDYTPLPTVDLGADTTICAGTNYTLDATYSGANYLWQDNSTNATFTVNTAGTYWVDVTVNNCLAQDTVIITTETTPTVDLGPDTNLCQGETHLLDATTPNVTYLWQDNSTNATFTVSGAGTYWVEVTDACGSNYDSVWVNYTALPVVDLGNDTVLCDGQNMVLDATTTGATYTWQDNTTNATYTVTQPGSYSVELSVNGCLGSDTVDVAYYPPVMVTTSNDTMVCTGTTIDLIAQGTGGATFDYYWSMTANTDSLQSVVIASDTSFTVYAENELGCPSSVESILVSVFPDLSGTISPDATICDGESSSITANAAGGQAPYTFTWSNGFTETDPVSSSISVQPTDTTTYTVTITDVCGTSLVLSSIVNVAPIPVPSYLVTNPNQCEPAVFEIINTTDPTQSQTIEWVINGTQQVINQQTVYTDPLMAGSYPIQMTVTSAAGCTQTVTFQNALVVEAPPVAAFSYTPNTPTSLDAEVAFINGSMNADSYVWSFENGAPNGSYQQNPTVSFPNGTEGEYEVMLIAYSDWGCSDTAYQTIIVIEAQTVFAPNAFTPNGDEFNNSWKVTVNGYDVFDFTLTLYNRWGELIWESHDASVDWDGTYNGKVVPSGIYTWVIRTKELNNDNKVTLTGHVTVIK